MYDFMLYKKGFRFISGYAYPTKSIAREKGTEFLKNTYPTYSLCALKVIKLKKHKQYRLKLSLKEKIMYKISINKFKRKLRNMSNEKQK